MKVLFHTINKIFPSLVEAARTKSNFPLGINKAFLILIKTIKGTYSIVTERVYCTASHIVVLGMDVFSDMVLVALLEKDDYRFVFLSSTFLSLNPDFTLK